jgi:hypothetical protein
MREKLEILQRPSAPSPSSLRALRLPRVRVRPALRAPTSHAGRTSTPRRASSGTMVGVRALAARRARSAYSRDIRLRAPCRRRAWKTRPAAAERARAASCSQCKREQRGSAEDVRGPAVTGREVGGGARVVHGRDGAATRGARNSDGAREAEATCRQEGACRSSLSRMAWASIAARERSRARRLGV